MEEVEEEEEAEEVEEEEEEAEKFFFKLPSSNQIPVGHTPLGKDHLKMGVGFKASNNNTDGEEG